MKTDLRRDTRSGAQLRPVSRELSRAPQADPLQAVLADYCEGLRDALRSDGLSPFELAGLDLYKGLQRLETSLRHCEKKRAFSAVRLAEDHGDPPRLCRAVC